MKILKIFGIVVGIHVFALILIFANPGCSSTKKPLRPAGDAAPKSEPAPLLGGPNSSSAPVAGDTTAATPMVSFNPNAAAVGGPSSSGEARFVPTRPGTPVAGALQSEPVSGVMPATPYTVKSGDNLSVIARKHNVTVAQLTAANHLTNNASLKPGQKLLIPGKAAPTSMGTSASSAAPVATIAAPKLGESRPAPTINPTGTEVVKHVVKAGETLGGIAKKYEVRQSDIAVANNIPDPAKIRPGMELTIPGWQAAGTKTGKASPKAMNAVDRTPTSIPASTSPSAEPLPSTPPEPASTPAPTVPVIRIDESSSSLPPKQP